VAIFATVDQEQPSPEAPAAGPYTRMLLPRTSVIAVGPATLRAEAAETKDAKKEVITTAVLTVAVTQEDAERLVHSTQTGELYFGLLSSTSQTGPGTGVSNTTLFQ
jgi:pilus assembly protein CpaB